MKLTVRGWQWVAFIALALVASCQSRVVGGTPLAPLSSPQIPGSTPGYLGGDVQSVWIYARVRYDTAPRPGAGAIFPDTITLADQAGRSAKGPAISILPAWQEFDAALNSAQAYHWLITPGNALVNTASDPPKAESITFGGNVLLIDQVSGNYGHVRSFDYSETPPYPAGVMNYAEYPQYIQKITVVNSQTGAILNPSSGLDIYFALLHKTDLWIDMRKVEIFPGLPMNVKPKTWVTSGLRVHEACEMASPTVNGLYPSQTAALLSYAPRGSDVMGWVQLPDGSYGCIALLYRNVEYTGWHMETLPPVRPRP